jgi:NDP-sugar pyrophosphorylase family protein
MIDHKSVTIVMPMAGRGRRFLDQGISVPKPLIKIGGRTIVEWIWKTLDIPDAHVVFIVRREHVESNGIDQFLKRIVPGCEVLVIDQITEGAACTVLLAYDQINHSNGIIIKDCDQIINWSPRMFFDFMRRKQADGGIVTIPTQNPGFSYVRLGDDYTRIVETREKRVISMFGCSGLYYFSKGSEFIKYASMMITKNIRVNNEYYVSPVYNEYIEDGRNIVNFPIAEMFSFNTPDELARYETATAEFLKMFTGPATTPH